MTRVKGGTVAKNRRRKVLKQAKGYFGSKHRLFKTAQEQLFHSGAYAYRDRRTKKRDFRKLWITRINAACRENDISYSRFINGLNVAGVTVNRKMLSELAIDNANAFSDLVAISKDALSTGKKSTKDKVEKVKEIVEVEEVLSKDNNLDKKTLTELKELAKEKNIKGYSTMKKADLIDNLK